MNAMRISRHVAAAGLLLAAGYLPAAETFRMDGKRLLVRTPTLECVVEQGAVTALKDAKTGEVFSRPAAGERIAEPYGRETTVRPGPDSACELRSATAREAVLVYRNLVNGAEGDTLELRLTAEPAGDLLVRGVLRVADAARLPSSVRVPVPDVAAERIILGSGATYTRTDPPVVNFATRPWNNLYSPPVALAEGKRSCIFFRADSFDAGQNVTLHHRADYDTLTLSAPRDDGEADPLAATSVPWRIGTFRNWADAARDYRASFERTTGARPLWENRCPWVRKIHAVHGDAPGGGHGSPTPEQADAYYKDLAATIAPEKLLLFYWNGNGIVLFGDHTYMTRLGWPKDPAIDALKKYGFRWMGYHPYVLIFSPKSTAKRPEEIVAQKWGLPEGYAFKPDYAGGAPEKFFDWFRPVATGYYQPKDKTMDEMEGLWTLHPGAKKTREYLVRNFGNYCATHRADGNYMDILGADHGYAYPPEKKVLDGLDWRRGEAAALRDINTAHPDLGVMSECQSEWTVPYTFYTWGGAGLFSLPRAHPSIPPQTRHPFRTALWGSYTWTREIELTPAEAALVGALPLVRLSDEWSIARGKLFADEELYNDLPRTWDPDALAYYRGKGGRWFQYRKLPYGEGFVELAGTGYRPRLVQLTGVTESPLKTPGTIQGWIAYRQGVPIGLDPSAVYPLLPGAPKPEGLFHVTGLPANAFVISARHAKGWSTVDLGTTAPQPFDGEVSISFHRPCLAVRDAAGETKGPFAEGQTATIRTRVPGGFVCVWQEPSPKRGNVRGGFVGATGRMLANGVADREWSYNGSVLAKTVERNGASYPSVSIGPGRYRAYAEEWIRLAPGAAPVLKFDVGYGRTEKKAAQPAALMVCSVRVNGTEVWRDEVKASPGWQPREVPLPFAGRDVLVSLSVQPTGRTNVAQGPEGLQVVFGRVRVDGNPGPLDPPASVPPPPQEVLLRQTFDGALDPAWKPAVSSAQPADAAIAPERGMLRFTGHHYKHLSISRALPAEWGDITAQARLQAPMTGGDTAWNPALCLYWDTNAFCLVTGGGYRAGEDAIVIRGAGARVVRLGERVLRLTDENRFDFFVRIALSPDKIRYFSSLDGKTWAIEAEVPRPKECAGAPKAVILGKGSGGPNELLKNDGVASTAVATGYIGELVIGRD